MADGSKRVSIACNRVPARFENKILASLGYNESNVLKEIRSAQRQHQQNQKQSEKHHACEVLPTKTECNTQPTVKLWSADCAA